ncbi:hypothetical protein [Aulosira sp. FACHB-615]|uniref:hypothetical protein n=1 Tax=Aulosira sp. FACHB-615 TaxID=2692777 RepID=UPI001688DFD6|nr:hypothetical protein [Aulosira sp. FACHB-615]MBD2492408.1 hypothetical protein [Aulosira sp. FACHB-615]
MSKTLIETVPYKGGIIEIYENSGGTFETKCLNPRGEDVTYLKGFELKYSKGQKENAVIDAKQTIDRLIYENKF